MQCSEGKKIIAIKVAINLLDNQWGKWDIQV